MGALDLISKFSMKSLDLFHVKRSPEGTNFARDAYYKMAGWPRISQEQPGRHHVRKAACESKGFLYRRLCCFTYAFRCGPMKKGSANFVIELAHHFQGAFVSPRFRRDKRSSMALCGPI